MQGRVGWGQSRGMGCPHTVLLLLISFEHYTVETTNELANAEGIPQSPQKNLILREKVPHGPEATAASDMVIPVEHLHQEDSMGVQVSGTGHVDGGTATFLTVSAH